MNWTKPQILAALHLYTQLPFGQLHQRNPRIQALAQSMGRTPSAVAMKLTNLASLDPQITANGRKGLPGASHLDREVWAQLQARWDETALAAEAEFKALGSPQEEIDDDTALAESEALSPFEAGKTRAATVQVRVNQSLFRRAVLTGYGSTCCISGLSEERLLIASHIVPWAEDDHNRLNPQNGLCLSALHDRAFDQGLITVSPDYRVLVSPQLKKKSADVFAAETLLRFDDRPIAMPERFAPRQDFLEWHGRRFGFL
jgi:putative restriction endonuclease